jgi:hypothetical protein
MNESNRRRRSSLQQDEKASAEFLKHKHLEPTLIFSLSQHLPQVSKIHALGAWEMIAPTRHVFTPAPEGQVQVGFGNRTHFDHGTVLRHERVPFCECCIEVLDRSRTICLFNANAADTFAIDPPPFTDICGQAVDVVRLCALLVSVQRVDPDETGRQGDISARQVLLNKSFGLLANPRGRASHRMEPKDREDAVAWEPAKAKYETTTMHIGRLGRFAVALCQIM